MIRSASVEPSRKSLKILDTGSVRKIFYGLFVIEILLNSNILI